MRFKYKVQIFRDLFRARHGCIVEGGGSPNFGISNIGPLSMTQSQHRKELESADDRGSIPVIDLSDLEEWT